MNFARKSIYAAAYTYRMPSRDPELKLIVEWMRNQEGSGLTIVGPRANSIENSPIAEALVSAGATYSSWKNHRWGGAERVIALWPDNTALQKIDRYDHSLKAVGVLTWNLKDVEVWADGVGAVDLLGIRKTESPEIEDVVVRGAMRTLTDSVNLSTGISHPSDWDHAVISLRALRKRGHTLDGDEIESWAIANGWSYDDAADLGKLVREMAEGKAKRTKSKHRGLRSDAELLERWAEVGAESDWEAI